MKHGSQSGSGTFEIYESSDSCANEMGIDTDIWILTGIKLRDTTNSFDRRCEFCFTKLFGKLVIGITCFAINFIEKSFRPPYFKQLDLPCGSSCQFQVGKSWNNIAIKYMTSTINSRN